VRAPKKGVACYRKRTAEFRGKKSKIAILGEDSADSKTTAERKKLERGRDPGTLGGGSSSEPFRRPEGLRRREKGKAAEDGGSQLVFPRGVEVWDFPKKAGRKAGKKEPRKATSVDLRGPSGERSERVKTKKVGGPKVSGGRRAPVGKEFGNQAEKRIEC